MSGGLDAYRRTCSSSRSEYESECNSNLMLGVLDMLSNIDAELKLVIAGNHDMSLVSTSFSP